MNNVKKLKTSRASRVHGAATELHFCSSQLDSSRSCKTMDTGPVHCMVCPFTPRFCWYLFIDPKGV